MLLSLSSEYRYQPFKQLGNGYLGLSRLNVTRAASTHLHNIESRLEIRRKHFCFVLSKTFSYKIVTLCVLFFLV